MTEAIPANERSYMPQLDALRVFAVLSVMVHHYLRPAPLPWLFGSLDWGHIGVRLFFVLSGFLITGILLDSRDIAEQAPNTSAFQVRQFYIRRFLRIFPIYYLTLAVVLLADMPPSREVWPWMVTYTSNLFISWKETWIGNLGHFWTLAVEEQFYLVWPWIVLFLPRRLLVPGILGIILLGPLYRYYAAVHYIGDFVPGAYTKGTFTFASLDCLGMGALLAIAIRRNRQLIMANISRVVLPLGLISWLVIGLFAYYRGAQALLISLNDIAYSLIFCWVIAKASVGFKGPVGKALEAKPLVTLGKMTYGIYIYHNLVPVLMASIFSQFGLVYPETGWFTFVTSTLVTLAISYLSWTLIEYPINSLKRYFRYDTTPAAYPTSKVTES